MLYNRCTGIYTLGNNTYPRRIRSRSNLGHIFRGKKVRLMGREIGKFVLMKECSSFNYKTTIRLMQHASILTGTEA
jgi:hypothetical protein